MRLPNREAAFCINVLNEIMQHNWYIIYVNENSEAKAGELLRKTNIDNFCPFVTKEATRLGKSKPVLQPLFSSYVFVKAAEEDIEKIKSTRYVRGMVYWLDKPAIVNPKEIDAIKEFTQLYHNIKLEKISIALNKERVNNAPDYPVAKNIMSVTNNTVKVRLPSLGFIMEAQIKRDRVFSEPGTTVLKRKFNLQSINKV